MNKNFLQQWHKQLQELSGNLTTNAVMPEKLVEKLLEEDFSLKDKISFEELSFPKLTDGLDTIKGLNILAGLQKNVKQNCVTLFRAMRFPTYKRIYEMISEVGYAFSNYEQERIVELYKDEDYIQKRTEIISDDRFWIQPQERVVHGLPVFSLVNDALQIHHAFRSEDDLVAMVALHIPYQLLETGKIKLVANAAIDVDYQNTDREYVIEDFKKEEDYYRIDYAALRARGIDLHEMYTQDLPFSFAESTKLGIEQEFFLLNIYRITEFYEMNKLLDTTELLKRNEYFLHGFFGDQNIFARRKTKYLPYKCYRIRNSK